MSFCDGIFGIENDNNIFKSSYNRVIKNIVYKPGPLRANREHTFGESICLNKKFFVNVLVTGSKSFFHSARNSGGEKDKCIFHLESIGVGRDDANEIYRYLFIIASATAYPVDQAI